MKIKIIGIDYESDWQFIEKGKEETITNTLRLLASQGIRGLRVLEEVHQDVTEQFYDVAHEIRQEIKPSPVSIVHEAKPENPPIPIAKEVLLKVYEDWLEIEEQIYGKDHFHEMYTEHQKRLMFFTDGILGLTTYDGSLALEFGETVFETMLHIRNKTTLEYIQNQEKYRDYIQSCNYIITMLDWGTSICGAWFAPDGQLKIDMPLNLPTINDEEYVISTNEEFMIWFFEFLEGK